jgi:16S rRNA processing protein RimM
MGLDSNFTPVARVSKLFGTGGEVVVNLYDTFPADYDAGGLLAGDKSDRPLFVFLDSLAVPMWPEKFRRRGQTKAVVEFADIDTPERATEFVGMELYVEPEGVLRPEAVIHDAETRNPDDPVAGDEIHFEDLVGWNTGFTDNALRGTVRGFIDSMHNPLFELSVEGKEVFVPAADEFIASFDPDAREIVFELPEGLLELYL